MDEHDAIVRCRQGDITGLEYLVRTYELQALRAAYLIIVDRTLAEDVVQEAFLHAYAQIQQFDATRPFSPWFLQSVVHRAVRTATRAARTQTWDAAADNAISHVPDPSADLAAWMVTTETNRAIWAAVARLPPNQRAVIVLRYYLDLNEAEMAAQLACPPGTIKSRLHTARHRLRSLLPQWIHDTGDVSGTTYVRPLRSTSVEKEDQA